MTAARARKLRRAGAPLPQPLVEPHPDRLGPGVSPLALAAHRAAVAAGRDTYSDIPTGYVVFTAAHHWAKGQCCALGCRHCPWVDADRRLAEGSGS